MSDDLSFHEWEAAYRRSQDAAFDKGRIIEKQTRNEIALASITFKSDTSAIYGLKQRFGHEFIKEVEQMIYKNGQSARDMARRRAPIDTGALRASIYVTKPNSLSNVTGSNMYAGYSRAVTAATRRNKNLKTISGMDKSQRNLETLYNRVKIDTVGGGGKKILTTHASRVVNTLELEISDVEHEGIMPLPIELYEPSTFYVIIGAAANYAAYIEYGTYKMPPRPFIEPAANWAHKKNMVDLKSIIDKWARR